MSRIVKWPARALGLDKSSLLRRCDRIEAAILAGLVMIFVIGGPLLAIVAGRMMDAADLREQSAERSWREVPTTVVGAASGPGGWESPSLRARWTAPDGQLRTGTVPMPSAVNVGRQLRIWVSATGRPTAPPMARWEIIRDVIVIAIAVPAGLGGVLIAVGGGVRLAVNRRRITGWERAWRAIGPQWSRLS